MGPFQTLRLALKALRRNLLRSFLTALGIIIGVAAVIAMVSIGEGARHQVEETFASMGTNLLIVLPGASNSGGARGGFGTQPTLTKDDVRAINDELPQVIAAAPDLQTSAQLQSEEQNWATRVHGTTSAFFRIRQWPAAQGVILTESDDESGAKVVVLGATTAEKLFGPNTNAVGQLVRIKGMPFQVIGVLSKKGQSAMGQDNDDTAMVPLSTFLSRLSPSLGSFLPGPILISAASPEAVPIVEAQVTALLRDRHRITEGADDDFNIRNLAELASSRQESANTLSSLLASIALVSLLVGGIGIMNIMLVSVTERTREIGIRMAVGATPGQVLAQFLSEALTLSLLGGLIGVGIGVLIAQQLSANFGWPLLLRTDIIVVATVFSGLVGVGFGLYPALKASRMDPITALRFE